MHSFFGGAHGACGGRTGEAERRRALFLSQGVEVPHDEGEDMTDLQRHVAGAQVGLQDVMTAGLADDGAQIGLSSARPAVITSWRQVSQMTARRSGCPSTKI